jgi:hypothetical protein
VVDVDHHRHHFTHGEVSCAMTHPLPLRTLDLVPLRHKGVADRIDMTGKVQ